MNNNVINFIECVKNKEKPEGQLEKEWIQLGKKALYESLTFEEQQRFVQLSLQLKNAMMEQINQLAAIHEETQKNYQDTLEETAKLVKVLQEENAKYVKTLEQIFMYTDQKLKKEFEEYKKEHEEILKTRCD